MSEKITQKHNLDYLTPELLESISHYDTDLYFKDSGVASISLRRHGAYERSEESVLRGQLTKETMPEVIESAQEWASMLPNKDKVNLDIVTSPTGMPARGPSGKRIMPARSRMTGALYGKVLNEKFGDGFIVLDKDERASDIDTEALGNARSTRTTDQRLGDIFEFTTEEENANIPNFFNAVKSVYGGLTPDFWHDYIRGSLPDEVEEAFLSAGGDTALEKSLMATDWILEKANGDKDGLKHVALAISHEEVIGSLAYQICEYLREIQGARAEDIEYIENYRIGYNQGLDIHVNPMGLAIIKVGEVSVPLMLSDFREYLISKQS
jgi:hypothetical protein